MTLDLKKYAGELLQLEEAQPMPVLLPPLAAIALIAHIQLAVRHPGAVESSFTKIAIQTARQLQGLFNVESETYKILEAGWNPQNDLPESGTKPPNSADDSN